MFNTEKRKLNVIIVTTLVLTALCQYTHASEDASLLFAAIISGDINEARRELNDGADPNAIYPNIDAQRGQTPLIMAISNGEDEIAHLLLNQPTIDVNIHSTHDGTTALIEAAKKGDGLLITKLLTAGANLDAVDNAGVSARDYGIEN